MLSFHLELQLVWCSKFKEMRKGRSLTCLCWWGGELYDISPCEADFLTLPPPPLLIIAQFLRQENSDLKRYIKKEQGLRKVRKFSIKAFQLNKSKTVWS